DLVFAEVAQAAQGDAEPAFSAHAVRLARGVVTGLQRASRPGGCAVQAMAKAAPVEAMRAASWPGIVPRRPRQAQSRPRSAEPGAAGSSPASRRGCGGTATVSGAAFVHTSGGEGRAPPRGAAKGGLKDRLAPAPPLPAPGGPCPQPLPAARCAAAGIARHARSYCGPPYAAPTERVSRGVHTGSHKSPNLSAFYLWHTSQRCRTLRT